MVNAIEFLSEEVHNAWWEEKKKQGFHPPADCKFFNVPGSTAHGRNTGDKFEPCCPKCHTDMYPYKELPENIKDYDRVMVRRVLKAMGELSQW